LEREKAMGKAKGRKEREGMRRKEKEGSQRAEYTLICWTNSQNKRN